LLTADWIAHGIIDSVVDSFFPVLKGITREVEEVEGMVAGMDDDHTDDHSPQNSAEAADSTQRETVDSSNTSTLASEKQGVYDEKLQRMTMSGTAQHTSNWFSRWKDTIQKTAGMYWPPVRHPRRHQPTPRLRRQQQLLKMTTTRRLVTTLARLLHSKSEVVAQIRKRLSGQGEVAIYLDDVQGTLYP
jgi:magnesium transporter